MKRSSLLSLNSLFSIGSYRTRSLKTALLAVLFCLAGFGGFAAVVVTPAPNGGSVCSLTATSPTNMGTITITEGATTDFPSGSSQIVLAPPTGWSFVASLPTITATGGDVTIGVVSITTSALTINFNASGTTRTDVITIANLQVQAASGSSSTGNIFAQTDLGVAGIVTSAAGTNFGTLSIVAASVPSVTIAGSPSGTICAGTGVTFFPTPVNGGTSPSYQFFVNGSSVGTAAFYSTSTLTNGSTVNAILTASGGGCFSPSTATSNTITMTVNPLPTAVTVSGGGSFCGSTTLTAANGGSGTIYFQGTTPGGTSTGTPANSQVVSASGTYYFRAQSAAGCWGPDGSATVTISALPSTVTVTGGGSFCGGTTTLNASNLGDGTIYYQGTTSNGTSTATPSTSQVISTSGTYYFRAQSAGGCWGVQGSQVVTINTIPTAVTASGAGTFCGSTTITAANGGSGTIYFQGTTSGGTSTTTPSASQVVTSSGTYYFRAQGAGGCWGTEGSVTVTINPAATANAGLPQSICAGSTTTLTGSIGGSATSSTWTAASGTFSSVASPTSTYTPTIGSGTITLTLTTNDPDGAGPCAAATSTVNITVSAQPTIVTVTGAAAYCGSGTITAANGGSGIIYFEGTTSNGTSTTTPSTSQIITTSGTYYFRAQSGGGCWGPQGSAVVTVNPIPTAYTVTGGGGYCTGSTGSDIGLSNSDAGINYQLFRGGTPVGSAMAGTNAALDFGLQTVAGTYSVTATNPATLCTLVMTGTPIVSINALPTQFTLSGSASYCSGGAGVTLNLSGSAVGVNYRLSLGGSPVGTAVAGTGAPISFAAQTAGGTYTAVATNATTGCTNNMLGSGVITVNPLPIAFSVTGGGSYCAAGSGSVVGLSGSTVGVSYQLFKGVLPAGAPLAGTGVALSFGLQTTAATYTVVGTNTSTLCTNNMTGSAVITINTPPATFTVSGGGSYCAGGAGLDIALSGSAIGVNYQLLLGASLVGAPVAGTGSALDFGLQTAAGTYTVLATSTTTSCTATMTGSAIISINPAPTAFTVTGGGSYCTGGAGLAVGLSGSQTGVSYQLYNTFAPIGSPITGTGSAISFGLQIAAGYYTIVATNLTTTCTNNMTGGVAVTILPLPAQYTVTGGGGYCAGGTGAHVGLSSSDAGVDYLLYLGIVPVGVPVAGTGSALDFGLQLTAGTYTVIGTSTSTTCVNTMTGSVAISIDPLPSVFNVTGGGAYCAGGTGVSIGLDGSAAGINYQLMSGGSPVGAPVAGTGAILDLGMQTVAGTYTVVATNAITGCTQNMTGNAVVTVNALPTAYTVTGGGSFCAGGTGFNIGLSNSDAGIIYQLYTGATLVGTLSGTGAALDFGVISTAGTYTVSALDIATGCSDNMTGSADIIIVPLPTVYTLSAAATSYCAGGTGVDVTLSGSDIGNDYQLMVGSSPVGSSIPGTGSALDFGPQTAAGTYTAVATNTIAGCTNNMTGSPTITINAAPSLYTVSGGGAYCTGGTGSDVQLSGSDVGVNYQLYNGGAMVGTAVAGTGSFIDFGPQTAAGTYTVIATDPLVVCPATMTGSASVSIAAYPVVSAISGPGIVCQGSAITLSDATASGVWSAAAGTSATVSATGIVTGVAGGSEVISYTVTNAAGCATAATTTVSVLAAPSVAAITGTSNICTGSSSTFTDATTPGTWTSSDVSVATVGTTGSVTGIAAGTATISYTVTNASGCSSTVTSAVTVGTGIAASAIIPTAATLCHDMPVGLSVATAGGGSGLTYQWYKDGVATLGAVDSTDTVTAPGHYSVAISNGTCTETLTATNVVAPPAPVISLDTIPNLLFTGSFVTFQWYLDSVAVPGATSNRIREEGVFGSSYFVVVSDANGCTDTSASFLIADSAKVAVKQVQLAGSVKIYPNPASTIIHIDAPMKVFVSVVATDGSVLIERKEAISINVGQLADGMYLVMVYDENNNLLKTEKLVKMQ